jgi:hypothetical protein
VREFGWPGAGFREIGKTGGFSIRGPGLAMPRPPASRRGKMKANAKKGGNRGKKLHGGKKLQKTKTLTTLSGPGLSDIAITKRSDHASAGLP